MHAGKIYCIRKKKLDEELMEFDEADPFPTTCKHAGKNMELEQNGGGDKIWRYFVTIPPNVKIQREVLDSTYSVSD